MLSVRSNLNNSFFASTYQCSHRAQTISIYGETVLTETAFTIHASIQPTSGKELDFLPESAFLTESIKIFSKEPLTSAIPSGYGDIVVFNGTRYQVARSMQWKTHCESIAIMEPINA